MHWYVTIFGNGAKLRTSARCVLKTRSQHHIFTLNALRYGRFEEKYSTWSQVWSQRSSSFSLMPNWRTSFNGGRRSVQQCRSKEILTVFKIRLKGSMPPGEARPLDSTIRTAEHQKGVGTWEGILSVKPFCLCLYQESNKIEITKNYEKPTLWDTLCPRWDSNPRQHNCHQMAPRLNG